MYFYTASLLLQRLLELEYSIDDDRRDLQSKVESLESLVRILEIKAKNSNDHGMINTHYDINSKN